VWTAAWLPIMQKVAGARYSASRSSTCGVYCGFGPSSKVSATVGRSVVVDVTDSRDAVIAGRARPGMPRAGASSTVRPCGPAAVAATAGPWLVASTVGAPTSESTTAATPTMSPTVVSRPAHR
jgi:hypothetical protein